MSAAMTIRRRPRFFLAALALALFAAPQLLQPPLAAAQDRVRGTGLPLPRFVSLKANDVNVRRGPGQAWAAAPRGPHSLHHGGGGR